MFKRLVLVLAFGSMMHAKEWRNWAKNQLCDVQLETPTKKQDIIDIITKAKKEKKQVRAYGSGHSWSDIVCVDGYLLDMSRFDKIIFANRDTGLVTVQAGIKIKDLNTKLARLGLSLPNQAAIADQSLAGISATATHGSGNTGSFASFITHVKLVAADGSVKEISATQNSELFGAARTNIGALGIVTELTIQCEPLFKVYREHKTSDWESILKEYKQLLRDNDFMQFSWNAATDSVSIMIHNRIRDEEAFKKSPKAKNKSGYSHKMLSFLDPGFYMEEEIAVPESQFVEAAQAVRKLVQEEYKKSRMFDGVTFRFVKADKNDYLSMSSDRDVVFFSITTGSRSGYERFYKAFYNLMLKYDGRPHWGKINYLDKADVKKLYGDNYDKFVKVRKTLDPDGVFSNTFTRTIFGW